MEKLYNIQYNCLHLYENQFKPTLNFNFVLNNNFKQLYFNKQPNWDLLGYITYKRTYARIVESENRTEEFYETLFRVVEGVISIHKKYCLMNNIGWNETEAQKLAQIMFEKMWNFKFIPSGRSLWMMGTNFVNKNGSMSLCSCGFISTKDIDVNFTYPFEWLMDCLMQGVGVGFDTKGAGKIKIKQPLSEELLYIIPDSREGWIQALKLLLLSYFQGKQKVIFDFSLIRPKGIPIKGFGGISSGHEPLEKMLHDIEGILQQNIDKKITSVMITDIMNYIGKCIVSGNIRRSAELALGDLDDDEFMVMKQDSVAFEDRRWASNNSINAKVGMDYSKIIQYLSKNGEPALIWLDNAKKYSRMGYSPDYKDANVEGVNPCFAGYEKLLTIDGEKTFEELEGKEVEIISINNFIIKSKIWCSGVKEIIKLTFDDGSTLVLTPNHILMNENIKEVEAKDSLNMYIIRYSNTHEIKKSKVIKIENDKKQKVYDFSANPIHWGFVNGYLVHNCGEQSLFSGELCNLSESFPSNHDSYKEYEETLFFAYFYAKTVTLILTQWDETNRIIEQNRRLGISQTGIVDAFAKHGRREMLSWCNQGYNYIKNLDKQFSKILGINESIKICTVKPSGTVSLLAGVSSGIHYQHAQYYIRRVQFDEKHDLLPILAEAGYKIESCICSPNTMVVEFIVKEPYFYKAKKDVSIWEQIVNAIDYQHYWSDNQVSITVHFQPHESSQIKSVLEYAEDKLKGVSFLPLNEHGYKQAPYEEITKEEYEKRVVLLHPINIGNYIFRTEGKGSQYCDGGFCHLN
ncbi:MAG: hypothetical protein WC934_02910 [Acidithiobacillus sp.]|jgi:hypothetical protein|uniref:hypothetical protein n=1 Tax=Acidithiobacillus sp. TaxID=1872118 RepID=UPI00355F3BAB